MTDGYLPFAPFSADDPPIGGLTVVDDHDDYRSVARLLRLHALLTAQDGRPDIALDACRMILGVARAAGSRPRLFNELQCRHVRRFAVGVAEQALAQGEPSLAALRAARLDLAAEAGRPMYLNALRGLRAEFEDFARAAADGRLTRDRLDPAVGPVRRVTGQIDIDRWLYRIRGGGWRKRYATAWLQFLNELIAGSKDQTGTWSDCAARYNLAFDRLPPALRAWASNLEVFMTADHQSRALLSGATVALAAEHFRRGRGRWPASLEELVPADLPGVPTDPFDGRPLRLRRLADGLVIYAVGPDEADAGGTGNDVAFRLWDPAARRQPPPNTP